MAYTATPAGAPVVIVMVTPLSEKGVEKCHKYWPDVGEKMSFSDGFKFPLTVECMASEYDKHGYYYSEMVLTNKTSAEAKTVHHIYYDRWEDFGRPNAVEPLRAISRRVARWSEALPIVHCSAGVGRTGTFITLDYLWRCKDFSDGEAVEKDTIEWIVGTLRAQRMMMVQSSAQYLFLYQAARMVYRERQQIESS
ncbi:hypothetical protein BABINDRAFT_55420 [Babjeviella inositovora NRRL Y-12698]|uniref:Tyrosine specific protein phosphatases domain-containing protein n=1 Tax=Babjeviella inositovora NRRL Y-12698 TaxID=984486 RepID=A0A1E3QHW1_9ASCO|nr:uncharacterized protein BABINDRAFT_55420 [Babjeviella inositovora NRRL Y-12698]ODQ77024.1 hypothetical protein BABINDRAFT_55420 [Babjeviella inositovora NRRL Y-12698]